MVGEVVGDRYRVLRPIGEGGMGAVYLCEHVVLGKRMALKVLRPELSRDDELVRRFQQEAVAASRIGQENIVDVIDFGRAPDGSFYYVMEALDGESLGAVLARGGPLPLGRALDILAQICRALAAAHARSVIHRDLKPDNVILVRRAEGKDLVKVLDFGISQVRSPAAEGRITRAGIIVGTPEYMAPEQAAGDAVDQRADVYAFGVVAYEVLTGTLPFQASTALATLLEHQSKQPVAPGARRRDLPPGLDALILRALEKRPEGRQQTISEVGEELSRILERLGMGPVFTATVAPTVEASASVRGGKATLAFAAREPQAPARGATPRPRGNHARLRPTLRRRLAGIGIAAAWLAAAAGAGAIGRELRVASEIPTAPAPAPATPTPTPNPSAAATPTRPASAQRIGTASPKRGMIAPPKPGRRSAAKAAARRSAQKAATRSRAGG